MNIFFLADNSQDAATMHCDKHVVKMIIETAQILSTNTRLAGDPYGYKITHQNHPATVWARQTLANTMWLAHLGTALCEEYTYRYGKVHATQGLLHEFRARAVNAWDTASFDQRTYTTPPTCMPPEYRSTTEGMSGVIESYRNYYLGAKQNMLTYTGRTIPSWITDAGLGVFKNAKSNV